MAAEAVERLKAFGCTRYCDSSTQTIFRDSAVQVRVLWHGPFLPSLERAVSASTETSQKRAVHSGVQCNSPLPEQEPEHEQEKPSWHVTLNTRLCCAHYHRALITDGSCDRLAGSRSCDKMRQPFGRLQRQDWNCGERPGFPSSNKPSLQGREK